MKPLQLNYDGIPALAVAFTRSENLTGATIRFFRKGAVMNHALLITEAWGQKFATEEGPCGLTENSLDKYKNPRNRIVRMMYWRGWDDRQRRSHAMERLAYIRRKQGDRHAGEGKYDWLGLLSFVPLFRKIVKPDPKRQWCSENAAAIHQECGAAWLKKIELAPDELFLAMGDSGECDIIRGYYCV